MAICSGEGPAVDEEGAAPDAEGGVMGSSMSGDGRAKERFEVSSNASSKSGFWTTRREVSIKGKGLTCIVHVSEQPLHRSLSIRVSSRKQSSLTSNGRETHPFEHVHRSLVELRETGSSCESKGATASVEWA